MTVYYKKSDYRMRFMNPYRDFAPDEMKVEIRFDPLTGQTSRLFNLDYKPIEKPDFTKLAKDTQGLKCPFPIFCLLTGIREFVSCQKGIILPLMSSHQRS